MGQCYHPRTNGTPIAFKNPASRTYPHSYAANGHGGTPIPSARIQECATSRIETDATSGLVGEASPQTTNVYKIRASGDERRLQ
jgi:hypothetical protein